MTATDARRVMVGEFAYLIPRTVTACWDVHCQPRVTVIAGPENGVYLVGLPDGRQIQVHEDDVVRRLPQPRQDREARPRPQLAGAQEVPLW